jgi:hypothetical protein
MESSGEYLDVREREEVTERGTKLHDDEHRDLHSA